MRKVLVVFQNERGLPMRVAERISAITIGRGDACAVVDVQYAHAVDLRAQDAVFVVAPVHRARHRRAVGRFVREHAARLSAMPSAFVTVAKSSDAETNDANAGRARDFLRRVQWQPNVFAVTTGAPPRRHIERAMTLLWRRFVIRSGYAVGWTTPPDYSAVDSAVARLLDDDDPSDERFT